MDVNRKGVDVDSVSNGLNSLESPKVVMIDEREGDDESRALLLSADGGHLKKNSEKPKRKVQWLDKNGDQLAEILEFQPSDVSDSEEEDSDSCICRIM